MGSFALTGVTLCPGQGLLLKVKRQEEILFFSFLFFSAHCHIKSLRNEHRPADWLSTKGRGARGRKE